ncbi:MAG: glycosyltransferase family 2 protein [Candidatus Marinimicrobia bacterium]|nr:glycosyltransferase family 2 protein [Candidatus Neomarinimicrobiota bacterium]
MISYILPIRNEFGFIEKTLQSILSQNNGKDFEILVADGMSDDGTREIVKEFQKRNSYIILINNLEKIVSTGFNRALSIAKGNVIIRVDGHSILGNNFTQHCLNAFEKVDAVCVGGATEHVAFGFIGSSIKIAQSSIFGVGGVAFRQGLIGGEFVDTLAFGAYKREVLEELGGYDEELVRNQDDEFNFRLIQNGGKIWLDPSINSKYFPRTSFVKLFKQYFQYGFYKIRVMQKRRGIASLRHLVPALFIIAIITVLIYSLYGITIPAILLGASYAALMIISIFIELLKSPKNILSIFLLPITFFILHFSYGIGFLSGMIYFFNKWNDTNLIDSHFNRDTFNENTLS